MTLLAPSQTITNRYGVIASLRYNFSDTQSIRVGYTLDYGRHKQTGELGFLQNRHPDDGAADGAVEVRLGPGGELRSLHADVGAATVHGRPGRVGGGRDHGRETLAGRIAELDVRDDSVAEEGRRAAMASISASEPVTCSAADA